MKKVIFSALTLLLSASLIGCGTSAKDATPSTTGGDSKVVTLKVGASPVPHEEILKQVAPLLEKEGVKLDIVTFNDYVQPNLKLADGTLNANFFQHVPYQETFSKEHKLELTALTKVHVEPIGGYSKKIKNISELADGASVAIPNDVTNEGRVLALLDKNNLIKLKAGVGISGTLKDIVENKKNLKFKELEAAMLPRVLPEVDLALINTNYALEAKLVPTKDALILEDKDSPYANVLTVNTKDKDNEALKKLAKALNSPEIKKFIEDKYQGAIVPAF
ncbi:MetQ/NlpA family ABC transporter substrate-binding protein [Tumebacillus permanentifrigoris]|uniref:Lipoprotein n=1 Tax=Tumebacillus permanentifrigoris TaxID=378543 RepID=A0A316D7P1_9BACL|nr:MetQ/NlpA family ABC transporter substrate-binding protein [Tumebacillus permanentifrigoris]PWK08955.1 D-methionine transport system substrate-binding protein [Tumebacillus permanentifrigoris]